MPCIVDKALEFKRLSSEPAASERSRGAGLSMPGDLLVDHHQQKVELSIR